MAMLGKRFQRTISMSQIGPGSNLHPEKAQAHPSPNSCATDPANLQKINEQLLLQAAASQWEALKARSQQEDHYLHHHHGHNPIHHLHVHHQNPATNAWEALKVIRNGPQQEDLCASKLQEHPSPSANQREILKNAEAMMMKMMQQSNDHESSAHSSAADDMVMASSPMEAHLHMGLWPHFPSPGTSPSSNSRGHFLDTCFLCKRRLRHERDIFIYRGDTAFCSEECRHRQILRDETLSSRAS